MRSAATLAGVAGALLALTACTSASTSSGPPTGGRPSAQTAVTDPAAKLAAETWVRRHGGVVALDKARDGWLARRQTWHGAWPWPSPFATVGCISAFGQSAFVQVGNREYLFSSQKGLPAEQTVFAGNALDVTTDIAAEQQWASRVPAFCPGAFR